MDYTVYVLQHVVRKTVGYLAFNMHITWEEIEYQYTEDVKDLNKFGLQQWKPLMEEILRLKHTLLKLEADDTNDVPRIVEHTQQIKESIPVRQVDNQFPAPIHRLLEIGPLKRTEVPLDTLELLTSVGFDVNYSKKQATCLYIAISHHHYNAVRWLVEHGADCNIRYNWRTDDDSDDGSDYDESPLTTLAINSDAPLELFDLLKTPTNMTDGRYLPLHEAVSSGFSNNALRLLQLGADINNIDIYQPIDCYVRRYTDEFHEELFQKLIPHSNLTTVFIMRRIIGDGSHTLEVLSKNVSSASSETCHCQFRDTFNIRI